MTRCAWVLSGLICLFGGAACVVDRTTPAARDIEPGEVRFELAGTGEAAVVVPVTINGQGPYPFVVDTGATLTCVDEQLAKTLNLPAAAGTVGYGATLQSRGVIRLVSIESLHVGNAKGEGLMACTIDLQSLRGVGLDASGLLGLNFLKAFRVTLDFDTRTLQLNKNP